MHPFAAKFDILTRLAKLGLLAVPFTAAAVLLHPYSHWQTICVLLSIITVSPCLLYGYVLTILHWKARYRGTHSDFWGIVLVLEVSSWFKVIYFFRHLLPDMRQRGKYAST